MTLLIMIQLLPPRASHRTEYERGKEKNYWSLSTKAVLKMQSMKGWTLKLESPSPIKKTVLVPRRFQGKIHRL